MRHTVEARADRWQRRMTGPWVTVERERLGLVLTSRYRRRPRIEWVRLWVAWHDLWTQAIVRQAVYPLLRRTARLLGVASPNP